MHMKGGACTGGGAHAHEGAVLQFFCSGRQHCEAGDPAFHLGILSNGDGTWHTTTN